MLICTTLVVLRELGKSQAEGEALSRGDGEKAWEPRGRQSRKAASWNQQLVVRTSRWKDEWTDKSLTDRVERSRSRSRSSSSNRRTHQTGSQSQKMT